MPGFSGIRIRYFSCVFKEMLHSKNSERIMARSAGHVPKLDSSNRIHNDCFIQPPLAEAVFRARGTSSEFSEAEDQSHVSPHPRSIQRGLPDDVSVLSAAGYGV